MFNADGTEGRMCGNGIRCVGKYMYDHGRAVKAEITVETLDGIKTLQITPENDKAAKIRVDMGVPVLESPAAGKNHSSRERVGIFRRGCRQPPRRVSGAQL